MGAMCNPVFSSHPTAYAYSRQNGISNLIVRFWYQLVDNRHVRAPVQINLERRHMLSTLGVVLFRNLPSYRTEE